MMAVSTEITWTPRAVVAADRRPDTSLHGDLHELDRPALDEVTAAGRENRVCPARQTDAEEVTVHVGVGREQQAVLLLPQLADPAAEGSLRRLPLARAQHADVQIAPSTDNRLQCRRGRRFGELLPIVHHQDERPPSRRALFELERESVGSVLRSR